MPQYTPLWTSILRSPKVFALEPEAFRLWVLLLALAQEHDRLGGDLPGVDSVAFTLHMDIDVLRRLTAKLIDAGFLDESPDGGLMIHDWREWRRKDDPTAAARKRRQRDKDRHDSSRSTNGVTRDISPERDRTVTIETDEAKPLRIARRSMSQVETHAKPNQKPVDVTSVTDVTQSHAYRTVHTEQNTLPLPPPGGGASAGDGEGGGSTDDSALGVVPGLEPFAAPPEAPGSGGNELSAAARAVVDRAGAIWGAGGHDWAVYLLGVFSVELVTYGARETLKWLNGRPYSKAASSYWHRVCQNHHEAGPPPDPAPRPHRGASRASPPITFTPPPADLTKIYHPSKLARMGLGATHDASVGDLRTGDGRQAGGG